MRFFFRFLACICLLAALFPCRSVAQTSPGNDENRTGIRSRFEAIRLDHICPFDSLLRIEANKIGWDWRMLAAIIYQESHFKPDLVNAKGAFGLMQLMPVTMEKYGIDYNSTVEEQLHAAGKVLLHFDRELPECINDSIERGNFILASYNAGMGTILKARLRAERNGKDPNVWIDNVEIFVPKQTYCFVREIKKRYLNYINLIE